MKLSIAICTHNEGTILRDSLKRLWDFLKPQMSLYGFRYEVVIVDDNSDQDTLEILDHWAIGEVHQHSLNNDFAAHKNFMNSKCTGDWILNLDADEWLPDDVLYNLTAIIEQNPEVDAYWFPRVNTVHGLTQRHVSKWHWTISTLPGFRSAEMLDPKSDAYQLLSNWNLIIEETDGVVTYNQPIVCWPDPQMRLYKNSSDIKWEGKVHERLTGFKHFSAFPYEPEWAIRHEKDITRQEAQNNYYDTLQR
jgi:glycosyltransferase involved in cell wall biosynthesis